MNLLQLLICVLVLSIACLAGTHAFSFATNMFAVTQARQNASMIAINNIDELRAKFMAPSALAGELVKMSGGPSPYTDLNRDIPDLGTPAGFAELFGVNAVQSVVVANLPATLTLSARALKIDANGVANSIGAPSDIAEVDLIEIRGVVNYEKSGVPSQTVSLGLLRR